MTISPRFYYSTRERGETRPPINTDLNNWAESGKPILERQIPKQEIHMYMYLICSIINMRKKCDCVEVILHTIIIMTWEQTLEAVRSKEIHRLSLRNTMRSIGKCLLDLQIPSQWNTKIYGIHVIHQSQVCEHHYHMARRYTRENHDVHVYTVHQVFFVNPIFTKIYSISIHSFTHGASAYNTTSVHDVIIECSKVWF